MTNFTIDTANVVELITSIPYLASFVYLIVNFTDRLRQKSLLKSYIIGIPVLLISAFYNLILNGYSLQADFTPYIVGVSCFAAVVLLINKDGFRRKLLITALLIAPTLFIEIFMEVWLYFFVTHDIDSLMGDPVANVYTRMFSSTFTICLNVCLVLFHNRRRIKKSWHSIIFLALFPLAQAMYLSIILSPKTYSSLESILVINTFFTLVFAVIFFGYAEFIAMTNRIYLKEQEQMMVAQIKDFDQQYYLMVQEEIKQARFMRHDLSNYIDQIQYLLDKNSGADSAEASKLLEQLRNRNLEHATKNYCENATVNMILNLEISKAQHYSPDVVIDVSAVVPTLDSIAPLDLSSIVFNTLNNAIRATSEFVGGEKKLEVSIRVVNGYLLVKTVNPTNENRNITDVSALKTTKSDTVNHGIGLQILSELAKKYNGSVVVEIKDSICTFVVSCKVE